LYDTCISWHPSNTHGSHEAIRNGIAHIAIVYDTKCILQAYEQGEILDRVVHAWMDHFCWIGPKESRDFGSMKHMLSELLASDACVLTRNDHSTIHKKESKAVYNTVRAIRKEVGLDELNEQDCLNLLKYEALLAAPQLNRPPDFSLDRAERHLQADKRHPLYNEYRKRCGFGFYRPHCHLPREATTRCSQLRYFTLSDRGIWLSLDEQHRSNSRVILESRKDPFFLNPAYAIQSSTKASPLVEMFMDYLDDAHTQQYVIPRFTGPVDSCNEPLYDTRHPNYCKLSTETMKEFVERVPSIYAGVD
jgi:hypothetical protein